MKRILGGMDERAFADAYKTLNAEQKKAVDTVEGPVLVVAGPGTGKTHILTLRVANILRETQASPDSILVLTFTESAARTVRRRLIPLIGAETAYRVAVHTFHTFAELVMGRYREFFPAFADMRLAADVETTLLWRDILSNEPLEYLGTPKAPFHYLWDLKSLRDDLVRERITTEEYRAWINEQARDIEADDSLKYVKGEKKGELNAEGQKRLERFERAREAARLIDAYEALKAQRRVYDFTDVLRVVVDELSANAELKATLQENFQYILADEHQDANALQHALLDSFAMDDYPNLFVVGDEKQAVFGFQGADSTHFGKFVEQYPRAAIIPLTQNFRSYQQILDLAHGLIQDAPSALGQHVALTAAVARVQSRTHGFSPLQTRSPSATRLRRLYKRRLPMACRRTKSR
jgi:DNA helicase-2/ATP-dependent DNA helicase PcrA